MLEYASLVVGVIGVGVVLWGVLLGTLAFVRAQSRYLASRGVVSRSLEKIRYDFGRHLLLGLEFLIAADIMRTIADPTLDEVIILGIIVAIRTVISYFLTLEIERVDKVKPGAVRED